jgi:hypothetical protein
MRRWLFAVLALSAAALAQAAASSNALAGEGTCYRLWADRNSIYKAHGYCFHTPRARSLFGNFGCQFWHEFELPLSPRASADIDYIVEQEYRHGCRGWGYPGY